MEKYSFSQPVQIQNAAVDFRRRMKHSALLRCIEQISTDHACAYGMDDVFFAQQKAVFLLGKQALRFVRVPRRGEQMTLTTFAEQSHRGSLKRITELRGEDGQLAALVDARWILVDTESQHILRQPGWQAPEHYWNQQVEAELPLHVHKAEPLTSAGVWRADYSLCDQNGHLNNACYLDIACDALPLAVLQQEAVRFACLKYHRQLLMGQSMEVFVAPSGEGWYVLGRHEGQSTFECYLETGPLED